jgi:hypothetical protein
MFWNDQDEQKSSWFGLHAEACKVGLELVGTNFRLKAELRTRHVIHKQS